jgi:hypothetical protein
MATGSPSARAGLIAFVRARRRALLAVFMAAELAVLLFILAQHAWPRSVPEAFGWTIFLGSYPWSLPWLALDSDEVAVTMAVITVAFAVNVVLATALGWYACSRWRAPVQDNGVG